MSFRSVLTGLLTSTLLLTASVYAQTTGAGTVVGQVTDQQNSAVPNAEVKLVDASTNTALTTLTNEAGRYVFISVPPAIYNLTVTKQGFSTFRIPNQQVQVGIT